MCNTSNALYALIAYSKNKRVLNERLKLLMSVLSAGSRNSSLNEFQAAGPATANVRRSYVLRLCHGTTR